MDGPRRRYSEKNHHGRITAFTIVELLIVIVVIGILAAITLVSYNRMQTEARLASLQSDVRQAIAQLDDIKIETGSYPNNADALKRSPGTVYSYNKVNKRYCLEARNSSKDVGSFYTYGHNIEAGPCPAGYWRLDGDATDSSLYGNNGTVYAANPATDRHGRSGGAYSFNGSIPTKIVVPAGPYYTVGTNSFTLSAWVKTPNAGSQSCIFSTTGGPHGIRFGYSGGKPYYLVGNGSYYQEGGIGTRTLNDNNWHMLTIVFSYGTNWTLTSYIDDSATGTVNLSSNISSASGDNGGGLIGVMRGDQAGSVTGLLDDVRFYNRALSAGEVKQLFEQ